MSTLAEEIRLYRAFTEHPPPVRVPALVHTDGRRSLVLERIDGDPVSTRRYVPRSLPPPLVESAVDTVSAFARWTPPSRVLRTVFDYPARIAKYHDLGFLDDSDHAALHRLLAEQAGIEVPFLLNRALVLARERRLDAETPDGLRQHARSALLSRLWKECRSRLHDDTGFTAG